MASFGPVGWDAQGYWKTSQAVHRHFDPYAQNLVALRAFHERLAANPAEPPPFVYVYSPLTLSLLRVLAMFPGWLIALLYCAAIATGAMLELWAGFQMADHGERRWLALLLPAIVFFPGLVTDDVILSGNIAYLLYGAILAAATVGWKRDNWSWYYVAVLIASVFKAPFLALLAFPVLIENDRRQWVASLITAAGGVLLFVAQMRFWPAMFREQLLSLRLVFDWLHDFGYGPASILGRALWQRGIPSARATTILYLVSACWLVTVLLFLSSRVRRWNLPRETWVPIALVGTVLLNPRIQKYDLAAITIPMLLIGWRTLKLAWVRSGNRQLFNSNGAHNYSPMRLMLVAGGCLLIPNVITVAGPAWVPVELVVLLTIFAMGIWSLDHAVAKIQWAPSLVPAIDSTAVAAIE
ncbi:MAG: hypothetical protein WAM43_18935 [Terriglobales bacterium]